MNTSSWTLTQRSAEAAEHLQRNQGLITALPFASALPPVAVAAALQPLLPPMGVPAIVLFPPLILGGLIFGIWYTRFVRLERELLDDPE